MTRDDIDQLVTRAVTPTPGKTNEPRVTEVTARLLRDLLVAVEELDVTPEEFWQAMSYFTELGQRNEFGLLAPGLGIEHFLDLRMDEAERRAGLEGGTPRTIEGPLYVEGAPLCEGEARLDDGSDTTSRVMFMEGRVLDLEGTPVTDAIVDVWHANAMGFYSYFGPPQSAFNLRRRIRVDAEGRYRFRSILPSGYACPPDGPTQKLLNLLGRHGHRPAHVHFMVSAPGFRTLTTQINIANDPYLHDDFAFGTRDGLIPEVVHHEDAAEIAAHGLSGPFVEIAFDFTLKPEVKEVPFGKTERAHLAVAA
jgi:catechol 1,2-dioxygenase